MESVAAFAQGHPALAVLAVFAGGLLSAASPCVLAVVPLMIGYVGGFAQGNRRRALAYSLVFALGLAVTFTLMGAAAGLVGSFLGVTGKYLYWFLAAVAILMGISLLGLFEIKSPFGSWRPRVSGLAGAFIMGVLFGFASTPCATPVLVVILALVAGKGQIVYGTLLLFIYAVGHCALIVLAGAITGFVESFAASRGAADFSVWAKRLSGVLVIGTGIYIAYLNL
jgi:cytochrome c biogenesis protein CcdA